MIHLEFVFLKLLTMLLGLLVVVAVYRAYRRYERRSLLSLALGFLFISVGVGIEGILFDFTPLTLYQASLIHTSLMIIGMGFILYSVYGGRINRVKTPTKEQTDG